MNDDPVKWGGQISGGPVTYERDEPEMTVSQPARSSTFVTDLLQPLVFGEWKGRKITSLLDHAILMDGDPGYKAMIQKKNAEFERREAEKEAARRAALRPWQRWSEDHPYWYRKLWPWTIQ